ncbi:hypothetical protein EVA_13693, partial [gut metagenome]
PYRALLIESWKKYAGDDKVAAEMRVVVEEEQDPERVLELICAQVPFSVADKMAVLSEANLLEAINLVIGLLETEIEIKTIKGVLRGASSVRWKRTSGRITSMNRSRRFVRNSGMPARTHRMKWPSWKNG